jgi:hypothetical protein
MTQVNGLVVDARLPDVSRSGVAIEPPERRVLHRSEREQVFMP